jgi:hypothetical protein
MKGKPYSRKLRQLKNLRKQYDRLEVWAVDQKRRLELKMAALAKEIGQSLGWNLLRPILPVTVAIMLGIQVHAQQFGEPVVNPFGLEFSGASAYAPRMVDIDNDGEYDMFLATYRTGYGCYTSYLYYENVGSASQAEFGAPQVNPFGLGDARLTYLFSSFGDLDNDGDIDLLHYLGYDTDSLTVNMLWLENTRTPEAPSFTVPNLINLKTGFSPDFAFLEIADMDNDGDADLIGSAREYLPIDQDYLPRMAYFENMGTPETPRFDSINTAPFNDGFFVETVLVHPSLGDLDMDGDIDMLTSVTGYEYSGVYYTLRSDFFYFENNSGLEPDYEEPISNPFGLMGDSVLIIHDLADMDGDGDLDIMATRYNYYTYDISFIYIENEDITSTKYIDPKTMGWEVFPNPTSGLTFLRIPDNSELDESIYIQIFNMFGALVGELEVYPGTAPIDLGRYPEGQYYMKTIVNERILSLPILITR